MLTEEEEIKSLLEDIENDLFVKLEEDNCSVTGQEDKNMTADNKDVNNGSRRSLFRYIVIVLHLLWLYKKTRVSDNKDVNTDS